MDGRMATLLRSPGALGLSLAESIWRNFIVFTFDFFVGGGQGGWRADHLHRAKCRAPGKRRINSARKVCVAWKGLYIIYIATMCWQGGGFRGAQRSVLGFQAWNKQSRLEGTTLKLEAQIRTQWKIMHYKTNIFYRRDTHSPGNTAMGGRGCGQTNPLKSGEIREYILQFGLRAQPSKTEARNSKPETRKPDRPKDGRNDADDDEDDENGDDGGRYPGLPFSQLLVSVRAISPGSMTDHGLESGPKSQSESWEFYHSGRVLKRIAMK